MTLSVWFDCYDNNMGHVIVLSCRLIVFWYQPISLQRFWLRNEEPIRIWLSMISHHWEFKINRRVTEILTSPVYLFSGYASAADCHQYHHHQQSYGSSGTCTQSVTAAEHQLQSHNYCHNHSHVSQAPAPPGMATFFYTIERLVHCMWIKLDP